MQKELSRFLPLALVIGLAAGPAVAAPAAAAKQTAPTAQEAERFLEEAEKRLVPLAIAAQQASWVMTNFITQDTQQISARAGEELTVAGVELAKEAARYNGVQVSADARRRLDLLKNGLTLAGPADPKLTSELSQLGARLEGTYGAGEVCRADGKCLSGQESEEFISNRDNKATPEQLLEVWTKWHAIAKPMRQDYQRLVEIANQGAKELGFADTGAMWRSKYDMPPDAFAAEVDRLWKQVEPLYQSLHCYVRKELNERYGNELVPLGQPIPAHLLGNMWAQSWDNLYPTMKPENADPGYNLTERLRAKNLDAVEMVRYGERFFTSVGFDPLPETFYQRSLFTEPRDRNVVCHASAWDLNYAGDLRIKMCININDEDFKTIHHELGHNFYQRAYDHLPFVYRDSANDGFHEAVGDTISLSITPEYLKQVGLIDEVPDASKDMGLLLKQAMEKIAFVPFGLLVDQWRWKVFSGEIKPADYNKTWWELRTKYQGVRAPIARTETDFDPGAKYHVPGNTPYTRYFLAHILQYQFHRGLCKAAGNTGPLHRCSIYGNKVAGERLKNMLAMGSSRPWPEALATIDGQPKMDATAILDYFAPLKTWLDQQNQGQKCGW